MVDFLKWYRRLGITTKQFLALFVLLGFLFAYMQWGNIQDLQVKVKNRLYTDSQVTIDRTNQYLSTYVDNIKNILFVISSREDLLAAGKEEEMDRFLSIFERNNSGIVRTLYIVKSDNTVYCSKKLQFDIYGNLQLPGVCELAYKNPLSLIWSEPYYNTISGRTVAFAMQLKNNEYSTGTRPSGVAVVEIDLEALNQKLFPWLATQNSTFLLTSMGGSLILFDNASRHIPVDLSQYPVAPQKDFMDRLRESGMGLGAVSHNGLELHVIRAANNVLGWNLYYLIDKAYIDKSISEVYRNFYLSLLLWLLALVGITFFITYFFTKPIKKLANAMDKVDSFDSIPRIDVKREDEIGRLANSYNSMMKRINALIGEVRLIEEQKKEYELKMLQSQIGPHFLYNTLTCIGSLAKQQKILEVRETIRSLVGLLSFSFDKRGQYVTVQEEIENLNAYLYIQKTRYGDIFDYHTDIAANAHGCTILKLTLQPLVENAIFHGLSGKKERGCIHIRAKIRGEHLIILVGDNGVGMEKEHCKGLLTDKDSNQISDRFSSIGIRNVHERLRLHFGSGYGLRITSGKDRGTVVRLVMPVLRHTE